MTDNGMIKALRGGDTEAFSPSVSLCFLCLLFFKGVYKGAAPLYSSAPQATCFSPSALFFSLFGGYRGDKLPPIDVP